MTGLREAQDRKIKRTQTQNYARKPLYLGHDGSVPKTSNATQKIACIDTSSCIL